MKIKRAYIQKIVFLLVSIAIGSQILGFDRDYSNYLYFFKLDLSNTSFRDFRYELGYTFSVYIFQLTPFKASTYFIFFALLSITPKLILINKLSQGKLLPYVYYASPFIILHDDTQVRLALALAFSAWGIYNLLQKNKKSSVLLFAMAFLFHYQTTIIILLTPMISFILKIDANKKAILWLVASYFFLFILFTFYGNEIINLISINYSEISKYSSASANPLNPFIVLNIVLSLWSIKILKDSNKLFKFFWIIGLFGILLYYLLLPFGDFTHRVSEQLLFFNSFWIGYALKNKYYLFSKSLGYLIVFMLFALTIYISYFKDTPLYFDEPTSTFLTSNLK